ncbi:hypothetical protein A7A08_02364 [Methyloligella halotolerans]|uniref:Uncharacterized protein n=1 Tax=Methyloligella halotolerans TaxID=1177755 RepID=A0A1E2RWK1_9HYPH|nr:hypothetical protein [Methyloligella halotolerans]ODA66597.1 hypothetical protein A7A08_02364 [Methyloligella halotolerans]
MSKRTITVFYAWQSDRDQKEHRHFIRRALDDAAKRINGDDALGVEIKIDADTEGVPGTPAVTETILRKIRLADIFVPDLTFVAKTDAGKLVPNSNVMAEYGYALHALTTEAMMPVLNTHYGPPNELPFDLGHLRYPTQYELPPGSADGVRRAARTKLSEKLEAILRLMAQQVLAKARTDNLFESATPARPPAFFFHPNDVLVNFGYPGEQELRFKRDRAIFLRLYPTYSDQPRLGLTRAIEAVPRLMPMQRVINPLSNQNNWGAISLQPHGEGITSFTQIFETGELWGVSEEPFRNGDRSGLVALAVEKALSATLENYRLVYENDLKIRPPFTVEFGAVGLKGQYLLVPSAEFRSGEYAGPILKEGLTKTFQLESFDPAEWNSALRDFLIDLYDLAARDRSKILTDAIVAAHALPPK